MNAFQCDRTGRNTWFLFLTQKFTLSDINSFMIPSFYVNNRLSGSSFFKLKSIVGIKMWSLTRKSVEDILQVLIVFAVESLELDFALLFPERHILLRVLPVLVVLATSSEKDSESLYKRVKINRLINIFKVFCSHFLVLW